MDTIAQVGTISAYLSLSEGGFEERRKHVGTIVEVGTISAYLSLSEGGCGAKLSKVGTIGCGFKPRLTLSGAKIEQSGYYRGQMLPKSEQSGNHRGQFLTNIWQSGHYRAPKLSKADTIGAKVEPK